MNETTKRYIISSAVTFTSVFLIAFGSQLQSISVEALTSSAILSAVIVAGRLGVKALAEMYITK